MRLTNEQASKLFMLGFGRQLSEIIFRAAVKEWFDKYGSPPPPVFRLADLLDPIDPFMVQNGLYVRGDMVNVVGTAFVCVTTGTTEDPVDNGNDWLALRGV